MLQWFKKHFTPREENNKPRILRLETVVVFVSLVLFLEVVFFVQALFINSGTSYFSAILPGAIANLTNAQRSEVKEVPLAQSPILAEAARLKAEDMATNGYFAHTSPQGKTPWYWFQKAGYHFRYAGENLAVNFVDSGDVVNAWMASVDHRDNILNADFTEIGVGVAKGVYEGRQALFVVQLFGTPLPAEVASAKETVVALSNPNVPSPTKVAESSGQAVKGVSGVTEEVPSAAPAVVPSVTRAPSNPSFIEEMLAGPHAMNNFLYVMLSTIVLLALILTVFVKAKVQHPPLIVRGASLLVLFGLFLVINQYLSIAHAQVF